MRTVTSDVVYEGANWSLHEIPRPLLWNSTVVVEDALGQVSTNTCPLPGVDADNLWACPTPPPLEVFGL